MDTATSDDRRRQDRELVRRLKAGDEAAFEELFRRTYPPLYAFARGRLGCTEDGADELAQRTLCRAIDRLGSFRGASSLLTWMHTILRRLYLDEVRTGRRRERDLSLSTGPGAAVAVTVPAPSRERPDERLQRDEVARGVRATLERLPEHYAVALELKYLLGASVDEVARHLELGKKAAESLLTRARCAFRKEHGVRAAGTGEAKESTP